MDTGLLKRYAALQSDVSYKFLACATRNLHWELVFLSNNDTDLTTLWYRKAGLYVSNSRRVVLFHGHYETRHRLSSRYFFLACDTAGAKT